MSMSILVISIINLFPYPVYAQSLPDCPEPIAITKPNPILNNARIVEFWIDMKDNKTYDTYKLKFNCTYNSNDVDAQKTADGRFIYKKLDLSRFSINPCEFSTGTHEIIVKAEVNNGQRADQCKVTYDVKDADTQCELTLFDNKTNTEAKDIYLESDLTISGKNLTDGGRFSLFLDNTLLKGRHDADYVKTPAFGPPDDLNSGVKVENNLLSQGLHTISLKKGLGQITATTVCSLQFTSGVTGNPGRILSKSKGAQPTKQCPKAGEQFDPTKHIDPANCSSGGGKICEGDTSNRGPGFQTAIGCVHTNPAEFVKDFMTWVLGIGGGLAFLMMLMGAFQMLTSAGNPETLNAGKDRLTSAVIGLLLVIFAILLLQIIGVGILRIPGFK